MRRALAILKYLPTVLCGLLVVAWAVSLWRAFGVVSESMAGVAFDRGCFWHWDYRQEPWYQRRVEFWSSKAHDLRITFMGKAAFRRGGTGDKGYEVRLPILLMLTLLSPLAVAPFTRSRFPLWSYFAWTALVAAELAYYLG